MPGATPKQNALDVLPQPATCKRKSYGSLTGYVVTMDDGTAVGSGNSIRAAWEDAQEWGVRNMTLSPHHQRLLRLWKSDKIVGVRVSLHVSANTPEAPGKTATISRKLKESEGAVYLSEYLGGTKFWNINVLKMEPASCETESQRSTATSRTGRTSTGGGRSATRTAPESVDS